MNYSLGVCLIALALAISSVPAIAAQPAARKYSSLTELHEQTLWGAGMKLICRTEQGEHAAPALRKGVSVELAVTRNAVSVPDADEEGSLIVAVTHDGRIYLGIAPVSGAALATGLKSSLRLKKKLYVKADARTLYANVVNVLNAASEADFESLTLLTSQPEPPQPGAIMTPKGLEVRVGPRSHYGPGVASVNLLSSGEQWPEVTINNKQVAWASLQTALANVLRKQSRKVVLINADGKLPFSDVVKLTDMCRSQEAEVVLARSGAR